MSKQSFEQRLEQEIAALNKQPMPERDLWPGIELALVNQECAASENEGQSKEGKFAPWQLLSAVAASIALVGVVGWMALSLNPASVTGVELVNALSAQHAQQKQALLVKFSDQPALTPDWQQQLSELDSAAEAVKAALQQDEDNPVLLNMLQNIYQQQIDLIERVHAPKWQHI